MPKKTFLTYALSVLLSALFTLQARGQESRTDKVLSHSIEQELMTLQPDFKEQKGQGSILFGVGGTNQYDAYLSPIEYEGTQLSLVVESHHRLGKRVVSNQSVFSDEGPTFQSLLRIDFHASQTPASNTHYLGGGLHYDAGWYYGWSLFYPSITVFAGGQIGTTLGGLYTTRNGNNPANAHANIHLSASVGASYRFRMGWLPISIRYQADLPFIGTAFSPNYGQSYYELWQKGGYDHNIVVTHPGNAFSLRQMVTASLHFGKRDALTIGYLGDLCNATLNGLQQHQYLHAMAVGWTREL